jgi:hypothetical protein
LERNGWVENWKSTHPNIERYQPVTDPTEVDTFLGRSESTVQLWNPDRSKRGRLAEDAADAVKIGFAVFGFDPSLPDDRARERFSKFLSRVRRDRPITLRHPRRGRPPRTFSIGSVHLDRWRKHRILALFDLLIHGHSPAVDRRILAAWLFPEIEDEIVRGNRFDEAVRLLDEARSNAGVLWAQERGKHESETI